MLKKELSINFLSVEKLLFIIVMIKHNSNSIVSYKCICSTCLCWIAVLCIMYHAVGPIKIRPYEICLILDWLHRHIINESGTTQRECTLYTVHTVYIIILFINSPNRIVVRSIYRFLHYYNDNNSRLVDFISNLLEWYSRKHVSMTRCWFGLYFVLDLEQNRNSA